MNITFIVLIFFLILIIVGKMIFKSGGPGSVESTCGAVIHAFNRLVYENPNLLSNPEELAKELVNTRWTLRKYSDDLIENSKKNNNNIISFKGLIWWMLVYEYDPPLQYKLSSEEQEVLHEKISKCLENFPDPKKSKAKESGINLTI